jgi:hypothetical protein
MPERAKIKIHEAVEIVEHDIGGKVRAVSQMSDGACIALTCRDYNVGREYSTHLVHPDGYCISGHYDLDQTKGWKSFMERTDDLVIPYVRKGE